MNRSWINGLFLLLLTSCATGKHTPCPDNKKFCLNELGNIRKSGESTQVWTGGILSSSKELKDFLGNPPEASVPLRDYQQFNYVTKTLNWTTLGFTVSGVGLSLGLQSMPILNATLLGLIPLSMAQNFFFEDQQTSAIQAMNIANGDPSNFGIEHRFDARPKFSIAVGGGLEGHSSFPLFVEHRYTGSGHLALNYFFDGRHGIGLSGAKVFSNPGMFDTRVGYSNQAYLRWGKTDKKIVSGMGFVVKFFGEDQPLAETLSGIYFNSELPLFSIGTRLNLGYYVDFQFVQADSGGFEEPSTSLRPIVGIGLRARY